VSEKIERRLNNSSDEIPVELPSIIKMWRSDSTKTESTKERSMNITDSIIRQNFNDKVVDGLNTLFTVELRCSYMLEAMAFYFGSSTIARPGLEKYLLDLSKRAKKHSIRVVKHMTVRGFPVIFEDIPKPPVSTWGTPLTAMVTCLDTLKNANDSWLQLHALAIKYEDPCTEELVKKIICKHVRLVKFLGSHVINLKRIGDDPTGVYLYDQKSFRGEVTPKLRSFRREVIPKVDILDTDFDTLIH